MTTWTIVTAFFDLGARETWNTKRKRATEYMKHGEWILSLPYPMVIYTDRQYYWPIWQMRKKHMDKTALIVSPLEEQSFVKCYPSSLTSVLQPWEGNPNPNKDTPLYIQSQWSKVNMVLEVVRSNPFQSSHFMWLDFGITHVANVTTSLAAMFESFPTGFRCLEMLTPCVPLKTAEDRRKAYQWGEQGCIGGGHLAAPASMWYQVELSFVQLIEESLRLQRWANDQMIWTVMKSIHPEWFECFYGDYSSILCNVDKVQLDRSLVEQNLQRYKQRGGDQGAKREIERIERSLGFHK